MLTLSCKKDGFLLESENSAKKKLVSSWRNDMPVEDKDLLLVLLLHQLVNI